MDEIITIEKVSLGRQSEFELFHISTNIREKTQIQDMYLKYDNQVIASRYSEVVEFFVMFDLFIKKSLNPGDTNEYFTYRQKKDGNNIVRSLQCNYNNRVYLSIVTIKTMLELYLDSKRGFVKKELHIQLMGYSDENSTPITLKEISFMHDYGYRNKAGLISCLNIKYDDKLSLAENYFRLVETLTHYKKTVI